MKLTNPIIFCEYPDEHFRTLDNFLNVKPYIYAISNYGRLINIRTGHIKTVRIDRKGYYYYSVQRDCIQDKNFNLYIHRAVAHAFVDGRTKERDIVNHMDGIRTNNNYTNLEWCTLSENSQHAVRMGLIPVGEKHHSSVYSDELVHTICKYLQDGYSVSEILELCYNESYDKSNLRHFIRDIMNKRSRCNVSDLYTF